MTATVDPSGAATATAAHEAGAVAPPAPLPTIDVAVSFPVRASLELARAIVDRLVELALAEPSVGAVSLSVVERGL